jgi:hypothetical protein
MSNASQHLDGGFTGGLLSPRHAAEAPLPVVHAGNLQAVIAAPPAAATPPIAMPDFMYGPPGGFAADGLPPGFSPQPAPDGLPPGFSPQPSFGALPGGPAAEGLPASRAPPAATAYYGGFAPRARARARPESTTETGSGSEDEAVASSLDGSLSTPPERRAPLPHKTPRTPLRALEDDTPLPGDAGGYARPPSAGGYGRPPSAGGYGRPPSAGGYGRPPSSADGYAPRPPSSAASSSGAYARAPSVPGGYGVAPPPVVPTSRSARATDSPAGSTVGSAVGGRRSTASYGARLDRPRA